MIQINIPTPDQSTAAQVLKKLLSDKLIYTGFIHQATQISEADLQPTERFVISAITRALLFSKIEQSLKKNSAFTDLMIYSVPVLNLSHDHHENLVQLLPLD